MKKADVKLPGRTLYWRRKVVEGPIELCDQQWKLNNQRSASKSKPNLDNLANDVGEANNVAANHPDVVQRLQAKQDAWKSDLIHPIGGQVVQVF